MTCLAVPAASAAAAPDAEGQPCKGTMLLGDKTYELKYAAAYPVTVFDDREAVTVLFTDQSIPMDKLKAALAAKGNDDSFFFFKPHVRVTFGKDGKPMFCNAFADNSSLSVSGPKLLGELAVKDGKVRGKASLKAEPDDKRKSSFDVSSFELTLLDVPRPKAVPKSEAKPVAAEEVEKRDKSDDAAPKDAVPSRKLPLPEGATDVEYKKLVGQIKCKSPKDVKTTASALSSKLADQGWKVEGSDLIGPKSAILKRARGGATLTVFVKPAEGDESASAVMIMSKGLNWDDAK
jgi:hypothetical protein